MISSFRKIFFLSLFFILFLLITAMTFAQTPYFKEKFKEYVIKKSKMDLQIGQIEGFFPFWMRACDIHLHVGESSLTIDEGSFSLSPLFLFEHKLSFIRLKINHLQVISQGSGKTIKWPDLPIGIAIYSLEIATISYNELSPVALKGSMDIMPHGGNFDLNLDISLKDYLFHINADADSLSQQIALITHIQCKEISDLNIWMGGTLSLCQECFTGYLHAQGKPWLISSKISIDKNYALSFDKLHLYYDKIKSEGELHYLPDSHEFAYSGELFGETFQAEGFLAFENEELSLSKCKLHYLDNHIDGDCSYLIKEKKWKGNIDVFLNQLERTTKVLKGLFDFDDNLSGDLALALVLYNDHIEFKGEAIQFKWNDFSISKGALQGHWQRDKPCGFIIDVTDFAILDPAYEIFPHVHLRTEGSLSNERLKFTGEIEGLCEEPFTLNCLFPLKYNRQNPLHYSIDKSEPFMIKVIGKGSLNPLLEFLENASLVVQGNIDTTLEIGGYIEEPTVKGYLTFSQGRIQDLTTGALFQNVELKMRGENGAFTIDSLTAQDSSNGRITGEGRVEWNIEKNFPFQINLQAKNFLLFALDPFTATTDAYVTLSGNLKEMLIQGDATIIEGLISIPNKLPLTVPKLEVTYINALPDCILHTEAASTLPTLVNWDIAITIPKNLTIEGRGFYSDWKGAMKIEGSKGNLNYKGELKLDAGRFEFAKNTFTLNEGKISIEGLKANQFFVDISGNSELSCMVVFMNVRGYLDCPNITFSSNPPLTTQQIFSRLLFDSDLNELTPFQACRLAKFLMTLSGSYAGPSVFEDFKESLGIDVFDITHCDLDAVDFTFQVGKYISQGTYVGINKSISGNFDSVEIQTRLYRDFFLQANYGGSLNDLTPNAGKIILKWYRTY